MSDSHLDPSATSSALERLASLIPGVLYRRDATPEGRVQFVSDAIASLTGHPASDFLGTDGLRLHDLIVPDDRAALDAAVASAMADGRPFTATYRVRHRDGHVKHVRERGTVVTHAAGSVIVEGHLTDVTEPATPADRRAAAQLPSRALAEAAPGCYVVLTPDRFEIVAVSDGYLALAGTTRDALLHRTIFDALAPEATGPPRDASASLRQSLARVVETGLADAPPPWRASGPAGADAPEGADERVWSALNSPVFDADSRVAYVVHRVDDVTDAEPEGADTPPRLVDGRSRRMAAAIVERSRALQRAHEQLRAAQRRIQDTFDSAAGGIVMLAPDGTVVSLNRAVCTLLGTDEAALMATALDARVAEADRPFVRAALEQLLGRVTDHVQGVIRLSTVAGTERWVRANLTVVAVPHGRPRHVMAVLEDITAELNAEARARRKKALLRIGGRLGRIGGWAADLEKDHVEWSEEISEILEFPPGDPPPLSETIRLYPEEWQPRILDALNRAATGIPFDIEAEVITLRGRRLAIRAVGEPEYDSEGHVARVIGALQDISGLKSAEERAASASRRLEATLEGMTDAFYVLDSAWRFVYLNRAAERMMNRGHGELIGREIWTEFPEAATGIVWDAFHAAVRDREPREFELYFAPLGHWFAVRATPAPDGLAVSFQCIDDRKVAEEAARQHAERFELVVSAAGAGVWDWDLVADRIQFSPSFRTLLGYDVDQLPDTMDAFREILHPEDADATWAAVDRHLADGGPYAMEYRLRCADGRYRWFSAVGLATRDATGRPVRMAGSVVDIDSRKTAEAEVRALASRLEATFASISDGLYTLDREWRFTYLNARAEQLLRRSRADLLGRVVWEEFPAARDSIFAREYRAAIASGQSATFTAHYPAPLDRWYGITVYPSEQGLTVYFRDVTDERAAAEAVRTSEERFRLLSRATNDAIWDWDLRTGTLWWNDGHATLFGHRPDVVTPSFAFWSDHLHPDDRDRVVGEVRARLSDGSSSYVSQYRYRRADGSYAWILDRGHIIRDDEGEPIRMIGGMTDLTERVQAEERVAEQAALIDHATDAIVVRDLEHVITFWSKGAETVYGWTREQAVGQPIWKLLYRDAAPFHEATATLLAEGRWSGELEHVTRDNETRAIFGRWTLLRDAAGAPRAVLAINSDVTQARKVERQFLRSQRLESIGTLAGGIAHDLNNVLTPILMSVDLLRLDQAPADRDKILATIEQSAARGADMVRQVLTFARGVEGQRMPTRVGDLCRDVVKIAAETFPRNIGVHVQVEDSLPVVHGDPTQLHQVLLNLCVNARDAMPHGGELRITVNVAHIDAQYVGLDAEATEGPHVVICVEDSGDGMPPDVLDKIFEPFYTTKDLGRGTGLGLSTSLAIVRSHGGFIRVYSDVGRGSRFQVYLPVHDRAASEATRSPVEEVPRGQGELVLVVDDEASVRDVTRQTLEAFGYRVVTCAEGADALGIFAQRQHEIAVVLTDMMMPIMDGLTLIRVLQRINPAVRIIAASGLHANGRVAKAAEAGVRHFLEKPYTADALLRTLHQVIHGPPPAR